MKNKVCLTGLQGEVFNYMKQWKRRNGAYPSPATLGRAFGRPGTQMFSIVGALFLKGAFTNGRALTFHYQVFHNRDVDAVNVYNDTPSKSKAKKPVQPSLFNE